MFDVLTCLAQEPEYLVLLSALIAVVVLSIGFLVFVMHRRLVRQNAQTLAAVNYMPLGFCMFDANKRLVLCNNVYADMYRLPADLRAPGATHDAIIGHRVLSGLMGAEKTDTEVKRKLADLGGHSTTNVSHRHPR